MFDGVYLCWDLLGYLKMLFLVIPETGPLVKISVSTTLFHPRQTRKGPQCLKYQNKCSVSIAHFHPLASLDSGLAPTRLLEAPLFLICCLDVSWLRQSMGGYSTWFHSKNTYLGSAKVADMWIQPQPQNLQMRSSHF